MSNVTLPNTLTPGTIEDVSKVQANDEALRDFLNGTGWVDTAKIADGAVTPAKLAGGSAVVTALPGSPTDGQEINYLADAVNGIVWHLKYRAASASAYKWEYVGGPPLSAEVAAQQTTSNGAYADLATVGPSITLPLAGDYDVEHGCYVQTSATADTAGYMSYSIGATGAVDADGIIGYGGTAANVGQNVFRRQRKAALAAVTLVAKYRKGGGSPLFQYRRIAATPVRV